MDIKTAKDAWTDEEKEQIQKLTDPLSDRVAEFITKELKSNDKLGLLEVRHNTGDYKSVAHLESDLSILGDLLSLIK